VLIPDASALAESITGRVRDTVLLHPSHHNALFQAGNYFGIVLKGGRSHHRCFAITSHAIYDTFPISLIR
jgi:hypothetical protein